MRRKIITTADGSNTIQIEDWDEQYHSKHGAIQEAYHVFIKNGLHLFNHQKVNISRGRLWYWAKCTYHLIGIGQRKAGN